jgi:hydroxyacylglutathione hydrolase
MMAPLAVTRLEDGVLVFQSELWATNSVLVPAVDACLVCDPSIFPNEIEEIRTATDRSSQLYLLVTHSDFDHVCGLPAFADATVIAGATTASAISDGTAARKLEEAEREWGAGWGGSLRTDVVAGPEPLSCGGVTTVAVDCAGHSGDGSAFVVCERGLMLPGDYLSAVCHPIVLASVEASVAANERLLQAVDDHAIVTVVPGHGPALDRRQAMQIAGEDIEYLRTLQAAAAEAVNSDADADAALAMVRSVPSPRPARPDFEALDLLSANAGVALAEAGHRAFQGRVTP